MRRILLFVIVSALYTSAFAQEQVESKTRYRHEVNVSQTGMIMPSSQWDNYEDKVCLFIAFEREHDDGKWFAPSSSGTLISYYYHLNHRIAVGAMTAFTTHDSSLSGDYIVPVQIPYEYWDSKKHTLKEGDRTDYTSKYVSGGKIREKSFYLIPSLKWSWLNNSWCSLYMKASIGLHYQQMEADTGEIPLKSDEDLDESKLRLAYIATPFVGKSESRRYEDSLNSALVRTPTCR